MSVPSSSSSSEGEAVCRKTVRKCVQRKRSRHSASPTPRRSRPRTRASIRASARSPSPPQVSGGACELIRSGTTASDVAHGPNPSRLNRARNAARKAALVSTVDVATESADNTLRSTEPLPSHPRPSTFANVINLTEEKENENIRGSDEGSVERERENSRDIIVQKKPLHPFFATTASAVTFARERSRNPHTFPSICDAWTHPSATIHVNNTPPLIFQSRFAKPFCQTRNVHVRFPNKLSPISHTGVCSPRFYHLISHKSNSVSVRPTRPAIKKEIDMSGLWAERYKTDARLDTINEHVAAELCDWLRAWYDKQGTTSDEVSDSEPSLLSELGEDGFLGEKESIAIILGPVGCGKSTVIGSVARALRLSVLEINSGVCRTGRRVRDIVGEALRSHRVAGLKDATFSLAGSTVCKKNGPFEHDKCAANLSLARSLILFEEVDELQVDEKGFWSTVLDLASSTDCKRPIICTANSFTPTMRQFFLEERGVVRVDFDRLLINTKEDQLLNAAIFKQIALSDRRSEREASSVLQRVALSEGIRAHRHLCDTLPVLYRNDIRKAVNQLQFWGSNGIVDSCGVVHPGENVEKTVALSESQFGAVLNIIQSELDCPVIPSVILTGLSMYSMKEEARIGVSNIVEETDINCVSTLDVWTTFLNAISECDVLSGGYMRQARTRNAEARLPTDAINMDSDLFQCFCMREDVLDVLLTSMPYDYKSLRTNTCVREVALHANSLQHGSASMCPMMPAVPRARRPLVSDVIPTLVSMACVEDNRTQKGNGGYGVSARPTRRTRLRARLCGFDAFDLDSATKAVLKELSIAPPIRK